MVGGAERTAERDISKLSKGTFVLGVIPWSRYIFESIIMNDSRLILVKRDETKSRDLAARALLRPDSLNATLIRFTDGDEA